MAPTKQNNKKKGKVTAAQKLLRRLRREAEDPTAPVRYPHGLLIHRYSDIEIEPRPRGAVFERNPPPDLIFDPDIEDWHRHYDDLNGEHANLKDPADKYVLCETRPAKHFGPFGRNQTRFVAIMGFPMRPIATETQEKYVRDGEIVDFYNFLNEEAWNDEGGDEYDEGDEDSDTDYAESEVGGDWDMGTSSDGSEKGVGEV